MKFEQAQNALARLNVYLPTLTDSAMEKLVYGKGVTSQTLVAMHRAATVLARGTFHQSKLRAMVVETHGALMLKAHAGDKVACSYLDELSRV